ncbi:hypothetical protein DFH08DRAFT_851918 [Mycena albidolilacea]|uniref:Uncharacterized protein n=1 Tax=Mycena albidolilacea TaxID=1033008 RepID=A0AAD7ADS7_9AGAR|nr:hypothetical protein DFH08DRAFT_851918 [Mycena albidolilacea]
MRFTSRSGHSRSCVPHRTLVCVGCMITIQRLWTHRILSMIDCCCSWIPSPPSAGRYACLVFVAPVCCYAHVVSDDRSHSSYVVDRPTTSACSSLTMNPLVRSLIHSRVDSAPPSVLPLGPSPCATQSQYIAFVSMRRPSPVTSPLPLPAPYRSTRPVPDFEDHTVADVAFVLATAFRMGDALVQCPSRSIQCCWLILATRPLDRYGIRRPALYCLWMTRHTKYHAAPTRRARALEPSLRPARQRVFAWMSCSSPMCVPEAGGAGSAMATRRGVLPGGSILTRGHTARRGWMEPPVRRCARRLCAGWMQPLRAQ